MREGRGDAEVGQVRLDRTADDDLLHGTDRDAHALNEGRGFRRYIGRTVGTPRKDVPGHTATGGIDTFQGPGFRVVLQQQSLLCIVEADVAD